MKKIGTHTKNLDRPEVVISFKGKIVANLVAGAAALPLHPSQLTASSLTRVGATADEWAHFCVLSLRLRPYRGTTAITAEQTFGFCGGAQDTPPATGPTIAELKNSVVLSPFQTVFEHEVRPTKIDLAGPLAWYKTVPGAADVTEETPGYICIAGSLTETYSMEVWVTLGFKTALSALNTPEAKVLQERLRYLRMLEMGQTFRSAAPTGSTRAYSVPGSGRNPV
jgi:hypothetical protein